jgi:hypothetical protein
MSIDRAVRNAALESGRWICYRCKVAKPRNEVVIVGPYGRDYAECLACKRTKRSIAPPTEFTMLRSLAKIDAAIRADCIAAKSVLMGRFRLSAAERVRRKYWRDPEAARHNRRLRKAANPQSESVYSGRRGARIIKAADGTLTKEALSRLFDQASACVYCEAPMRSTSEKSLDHFIPLK